VRSVRKQLYISQAHDRKLKRLAKSWQCTEAAVVRRALDGLDEGPATPEARFVESLRAGGKLVESPDAAGTPSRDEAAQIEGELAVWFAAHPEPLRLDEALRDERDA
jgi:hypothetical protein